LGLGASTDGVSTSTIHDNQPGKAGDQSLNGANCGSIWLIAGRAIGQWRRRLECVVQQQGGHIEHLM